MRFLAIAVVFAAAATCCLAEDVRELISKANQEGAPFTSSSLNKLESSDAWGHKRANRSIDVVIMNPSGKSFQVIFNKCALGSLSSDLIPETQLNSRTSTIYGLESSKYRQGVQCTLVWEDSRSGAYFTVMLDNPFYGDNVVYTSSSYDLKVIATLGLGNNNQVQIRVYNSGSPMLSSSRSQSGSSQKQRGGRNIAIKASKSGSRYHTL